VGGTVLVDRVADAADSMIAGKVNRRCIAEARNCGGELGTALAFARGGNATDDLARR